MQFKNGVKNQSETHKKHVKPSEYITDRTNKVGNNYKKNNNT